MSCGDSILLNSSTLDFGFKGTFPNIIKVIGVGGGGCRSVNCIQQWDVKDIDFVVCDTDFQSLSRSLASNKILLGPSLTEGRGAGNSSEKGEQAAIESTDGIRQVLDGFAKMVCITAGMGGGTGTGAIPVIAKIAKEMGFLTVAIVSIPSPLEGKKRLNQALIGLEKLEKIVDSLLVIQDEKLQQICGDLPASCAYAKVDEMIAVAIRRIAEMITIPGTINIDFNDVQNVLYNSGGFIIGIGFAEGNERVSAAYHNAIEYPLFEKEDLINLHKIVVDFISGEEEIKMSEIGEILEILQRSTAMNADIVWGSSINLDLGRKICITILATGFKENNISSLIQKETVKFELSDLESQLSDPEEKREDKFTVDSKGEKEIEFDVSRSNKEEAFSLRDYKMRNEDASAYKENWLLKQFSTIFEEKESDISDLDK